MSGHPTVKIGSKSGAVKALQAILNRVVAPTPRLDEDGHFGAGTGMW